MFRFIFRFSCKKLVKYCIVLLICSYLINTVNGIFNESKSLSVGDNQPQIEDNLKNSKPENKKHESFNERATKAIEEYKETKTNEHSPYYKEDGTNPVRQGALHEEVVNTTSEHPGSAWINKEGHDVVQDGIDSENRKPRNEKPFINSDNSSSEEYRDNECFR